MLQAKTLNSIQFTQASGYQPSLVLQHPSGFFFFASFWGVLPCLLGRWGGRVWSFLEERKVLGRVLPSSLLSCTENHGLVFGKQGCLTLPNQKARFPTLDSVFGDQSEGHKTALSGFYAGSSFCVNVWETGKASH